MKKHEKAEPSFFRWIRAARAEISRDTEGMTAEEHAAYIHGKARESRLERAADGTKNKTRIAVEV